MITITLNNGTKVEVTDVQDAAELIQGLGVELKRETSREIPVIHAEGGRPCEICGNQIPQDADKRARYCSLACRKVHAREYNKKYLAKKKAEVKKPFLSF